MTVIAADREILVHKFTLYASNWTVAKGEICDAVKYNRRPILDLSAEPVDDVIQALYFMYTSRRNTQSYDLPAVPAPAGSQVTLVPDRPVYRKGFLLTKDSDQAGLDSISTSLRRHISVFAFALRLGFRQLQECARETIFDILHGSKRHIEGPTALIKPPLARLSDLHEIIAYAINSDDTEKSLRGLFITRLKRDEAIGNCVSIVALEAIATVNPEFLVDYSLSFLAQCEDDGFREQFKCECRPPLVPFVWAIPSCQCGLATEACTKDECAKKQLESVRCQKCGKPSML
jgi:hypothetical protein